MCLQTGKSQAVTRFERKNGCTRNTALERWHISWGSLRRRCDIMRVRISSVPSRSSKYLSLDNLADGLEFLRQNGLTLLMVINGVSMLMLTQATTLPFFIVCVVLVGFSFGGLLVVFAPMVRMIFGSRFYNRNYGLIFIGYGIGAFVGPKISAYFYDTTGQYTLGFIGSAILAVAAIVLIVIAQKMAGKMENAQ